MGIGDIEILYHISVGLFDVVKLL